MRSIEEISKEEIRDLLGKGWLTHDGAWFLNTAQQLGIETANKLNKAAIRTMAPFEMHRTMKVLGLTDEGIQDFDTIKVLAQESLNLILPSSVSSKLVLENPSESTLRWKWNEGDCFAYKGMQTLGLLEGYECGVIFRLECWLDALDIQFEVEPEITSCLMHTEGSCSGEFRFNFASD